MTDFKEVYDAVERGDTVFWKQPNYRVRMRAGEYYIVCTNNNHMVGLYEPDYDPADFYKEMKQ